METLELSDLVFEVRRSSRRSTFGLTVDRGGELVIHAPVASDRDELARWTRSKLLWIHRKLIRKAEVVPSVREPEFVSGEGFWYLGKAFRLKLARNCKEPLSFDGRNFILSVTAQPKAAVHFKLWYIKVGRTWVCHRIVRLSRRLGVQPNRVDIHDLGYRWGSCGQSGVVHFNWKLLQLSPRLIDYVIAHELAHLIEPRHGREMWRILNRSLPDWQLRSEELKVRARDIYWCHKLVVR